MRVRIVVADRAEARFYEVEPADSALIFVSTITDPQARKHDRDFQSDRPGRVFDHAPGLGRRGAVARHATGGERTPREHESELFAARIVAELEQAQRDHRFNRLVVMAEPGFLGQLRHAMPESLKACLVLEVHKDLVHYDQAAIRANLPRAVFSTMS